MGDETRGRADGERLASAGGERPPTFGRVAVVGGGITGLAAAHRLAELDVEVVLLEGASRCGGVVRTESVEGFLVEAGPDSWLGRKPWAADLCRRVGLGDEIVAADPPRRGAFIWSRGELHPLPEGLTSLVPTRLGPLARTRLLSPAGKARLLLEPLVPRGPQREDEPLAGFFRRRLGREASERLVEPLVRGIYGGDAESLSLRATFPQLAEIERRHRSLVLGLLRESRAVWRTPPGAPDAFLSLRRGMGSLVDRLLARLPSRTLRTRTPVDGLRRLNDGRLALVAGAGEELAVEAAVLAIPAVEAARLLGPLDPALGALLGGIRAGSSVTVSLGYGRDHVRHPLLGTGFVVPEAEGSPLLACTWASSKLPGRAPDGSVLLRAFLADPASLLELEDSRIAELAAEVLAPILGLEDAPRLARVHRWRDAIPRYALGHPARVAEIERRLAVLPGTFLAGAAYHGVGIPDCIRSGESAAEAAFTHLARRPALLGHFR